MNPFPDTISQYALKLAETIRESDKWFLPVDNVGITYSESMDDVYFKIDFKKSSPDSKITEWELYRISLCDLLNAERSFKDKTYYMILDNWGIDID